MTMSRAVAERLILEHLGMGWEVSEPSVMAVRVLLDRLQDEGLTIQEARAWVKDVAFVAIYRTVNVEHGAFYEYRLHMLLKEAVESAGLV